MDNRIADLYAELAFPSASRLLAALRKEGITVSLSDIKEVVSKTGSRQFFNRPLCIKGTSLLIASMIDGSQI